MHEKAPEIGAHVGLWEIIGTPFRELRGKRLHWFIPCRCSCGTEHAVFLFSLLKGESKSCGCERSVTHGHTRQHTPSVEYQTWARMMRRCYNPNHDRYRFYGGQGITVAEEWHDFANFLRAMGPKPFPKAVLDRIDSAGPYAPGNCRWTTQRENTNNTRRNVWIEWDGRRQTVSQWAHELGLEPERLHGRLKAGWDIEKALTAPIRSRPQKTTPPEVSSPEPLTLPLE
jgi:hypothetical protein